MDYVTIRGEAEAKYEERRSVFIASVKGIENFDEGMEFVKRVSKTYSDATHNCYAILTRSGEQKFSDAGEPQGTAGTPILTVLKRTLLTDVACVITRYFGGIKLGASGLVSAYSKATSLGIECAEKVLKRECVRYETEVSYSDYPILTTLVSKKGGLVSNVAYHEGVTVFHSIPVLESEAFENAVKESFGGKRLPKQIGTGYETFPYEEKQ
ncbi:MAG: YigZ family protein [Clostridia bacterium]|nr:YigZ family protein [Clostridia bacterium]